MLQKVDLEDYLILVWEGILRCEEYKVNYSWEVLTDLNFNFCSCMWFDPWQGEKFSFASRSALGPTLTPIWWLLRALSLEVQRGRGVTVTTHALLISGSVTSRSYFCLIFSPIRRNPCNWKTPLAQFMFFRETFFGTVTGSQKKIDNCKSCEHGVILRTINPYPQTLLTYTCCLWQLYFCKLLKTGLSIFCSFYT